MKTRNPKIETRNERRRDFLKRAAFVSAGLIWVPKHLAAQSVATADGLASFIPPATSGAGGGCTPSYANTGGTGNRTGILTVTPFWSGGSLLHASGSTLVDGDTTSNGRNWFAANQNLTTNPTITFDFGAAKLITEAKYYQQNSTSQGTWQWRGSNDDSTWTNIGGTFLLATAATTTLTTLSANTTQYRYYQIQGVSGSSNAGPYIYQFEFKIC